MSDARTMTVAVPFGPPARAACELVIARAARVAEHLPPAGAGVVARAFWEDAAGELAFAELREDDHLVLGRHARCDVRLRDPAVSLRHVLLRARRDVLGKLSILAQDLATELGFHVDDARVPTLGASIDGPAVLGIAGQLVALLPTGAPAADESALRPRLVDADPEDARPIAEERAALAVRTQLDSYSRTTIHPIPAPLSVEVLDAVEAPFARIALRGPQARVVFTASAEDLDRLVLIGRYTRCRRGALSPFSDWVSRVHAAITRDGAALRVIDLASTNGLATRSGGKRAEEVRAIRVTTRASIVLASSSAGGARDRLDLEIVG